MFLIFDLIIYLFFSLSLFCIVLSRFFIYITPSLFGWARKKKQLPVRPDFGGV